MHSLLLGIFTFCALVSSSALSAQCSFESAEDVAPYISCGDQLSISRCLSQLNRFDLIEECLTDAGCSKIEAATTAELLRANCALAGSGEDLRKRQKNEKSKTTTAPKTTDTPTTSADTTSTESAAATTAAASTTDTPSTSDTTSATDTSTPSSSTASSTAPSTTLSTSTSTSTMATTASAATTGSTSSALTCQTTSQMSTTWCITSTAAGGATASTCIPTTTPIIGCAPGLICQTQEDNLITCMHRQDNLTVSGLVVTIIFGAVILGFIVALCAMCYKSDQLSRKTARQREAAMLASLQAKNMRDVESSNNYMRGTGADAAASEAYLPLMAAQGPAGGSSIRDRSTDYASTRPAVHRVPSGSYQDVVASRTPGAPKLHPGLMGMSGEEDDMGYGRGRQ